MSAPTRDAEQGGGGERRKGTEDTPDGVAPARSLGRPKRLQPSTDAARHLARPERSHKARPPAAVRAPHPRLSAGRPAVPPGRSPASHSNATAARRGAAAAPRARGGSGQRGGGSGHSAEAGRGSVMEGRGGKVRGASHFSTPSSIESTTYADKTITTRSTESAWGTGTGSTGLGVEE